MVREAWSDAGAGEGRSTPPGALGLGALSSMNGRQRLGCGGLPLPKGMCGRSAGQGEAALKAEAAALVKCWVAIVSESV